MNSNCQWWDFLHLLNISLYLNYSSVSSSFLAPIRQCRAASKCLIFGLTSSDGERASTAHISDWLSTSARLFDSLAFFFDLLHIIFSLSQHSTLASSRRRVIQILTYLRCFLTKKIILEVHSRESCARRKTHSDGGAARERLTKGKTKKSLKNSENYFDGILQRTVDRFKLFLHVRGKVKKRIKVKRKSSSSSEWMIVKANHETKTEFPPDSHHTISIYQLWIFASQHRVNSTKFQRKRHSHRTKWHQ